MRSVWVSCLVAVIAFPALAQSEPETDAVAIRSHVAGAPTLTAALANDRIDVDVSYTGARITLFAVSTAPNSAEVAYAVALVGPHRPYAITRHTETTGKKRLEFVSAPAVLAVAAEEELPEVATTDALIRARIHDRYAAKVDPGDLDDPELDEFREAFANLKRESGLFYTRLGGVTRLSGGLIRADIDLPAAAPPGDYDVRIFMFQDGVLASEAQAPLTLARKGTERTLWHMARNLPVVYGIFAVCLGVFAGGVGAALGRRE